jgi:hypothetical protein
VLLRAFTIPQLYGPKPSAVNEEGVLSSSFGTQDMFRMERSLFVRVIEARLLPPLSPKLENGTSTRPTSSVAASGGFYVEVLLDGETRARTMAKSEGNTPFWREEFEFQDVPAALSTASLLLKKRIRSQVRPGKETYDSQDSFVSEASGGYAGISFDQTYGKADIFLDDLGPNQEIERWWPLVNMYNNAVGEVLVKISAEECVILMARDYQPMSELLHRFENGLTLQIAQMIPNELKKLSEYLLNIFQVSGQAIKWISSLIEEEIDGTLKESPASRLRFSKRLGSTESGDSANSFPSNSERELFLRDMGNNAKLEANLLFRGNTLLTKALDYHMKRLGKEYLEETLCEKLREIDERDYECEVDPNRIEGKHELERNWRRLINLTEEIWRSIYNSVSRCPQELRLIFRHIQACAEDRYGDFLRTVKYSSVSGFLFLRFFVPAVLNPKLFGLLKGMCTPASPLHGINLSRPPETARPSHPDAYCQILARPCKYVILWHQRILDGAHERISHVSPSRVQDLPRQHLLHIFLDIPFTTHSTFILNSASNPAEAATDVTGRLPIASIPRRSREKLRRLG